MSRPSLDIVVVSYNTRDDLAACLGSIAAAPPEALQTIFVVDNASADGSAAMVAERWPAVQLLALDRNLGFGAANNVALRRSRADLVLLLNSDTLAPAGAIDALVDRLAATGAAAAGPRLVDADGRPEISFGAMLSPARELAQRARVRMARSRRRLAVWLTARRLRRERDVDWVSGACLLVRRDAALAAGLFDERYFLYEEDVDLCAAIRAGGGRILFTPGATVTHLGGRSSPGATATAHYDRSHVAFYEKHRPGWAPWLRAWLRLRGRTLR
jgi:GT2 family glycosyltransferase